MAIKNLAVENYNPNGKSTTPSIKPPVQLLISWVLSVQSYHNRGENIRTMLYLATVRELMLQQKATFMRHKKLVQGIIVFLAVLSFHLSDDTTARYFIRIYE